MSRLGTQLAGLIFLVIMGLLAGLSVAFYDKAFTTVVSVALRTDHAGNQLQAHSDVKVRGLVVGEVRAVRTTGQGAEIELALQPDKMHLLPHNVSARLLPKTLFGQRYVNLVLPDRPDSRQLGEGDVIDQDRTTSALELEKALRDLMSMLQAIQPQKLSTALGALSRALQGRGKPLGDTLVELNGYLDQLNPKMPVIQADITRFADAANTYTSAAPDLVQALSDFSVTAKTIVDQRTNLEALYASVTTASTDLTTFIADNKDNAIHISADSKPTLALWAKYSPEFPCLAKAAADLIPTMDQALGAGTAEPGLHIVLDIQPSSGKYVPGKDDPAYGKGSGPRCPLSDLTGSDWGGLLVGPLLRGSGVTLK